MINAAMIVQSPPPPPMMSRAEWEKLVKQEAREKAIAARTQEREKQANMYWLKGDWCAGQH